MRMFRLKINPCDIAPTTPNQLMQPRSLPPLGNHSVFEVTVGGRAPADRRRWASLR